MNGITKLMKKNKNLFTHDQSIGCLKSHRSFILTFFFIFFILYSYNAYSEYRVFRHKILTKIEGESEPEVRYIESTLDPDQFVGYYPLSKNETITYVSTWKCRGRTSNFKRHCPNPKEKSTEDEETPISMKP